MNYKRLTINLANGKIGCLQEYTQTDLINRLAELEDKIENKTLIELPCKVGDTFYGIQGDDCFAYCCYGFKYGLRRGEDDDSRVLYLLTIYEMEFVWGEEAFLTEAEAEAKLKALKGE